ncbi:MAG TPA: protoglobin domain-containing protein [Gemmatimonadaceae bacterium]|nr:protoglobin domain-containing protein [Gemmatimonadaceae bacterium]
MANTTSILGYTYGTSHVARSPISISDFDLIKKSALFGDEDIAYLKMSFEVLEDQVEEILDVWYGFVAANPHLLATFSSSDGAAIPSYLQSVRRRFGQWILDTARGEYDQTWLDYQHEIGMRHHRSKKNKTDSVIASEIVPFRYLVPLVFPITFTLRPFLAKKGHTREEVDKMYFAWLKSCLIQVTLWSYAYVASGDF